MLHGSLDSPQSYPARGADARSPGHGEDHDGPRLRGGDSGDLLETGLEPQGVSGEFEMVGRTLGKPWLNHGKIMGTPQEHGKIMGKSWENQGETMGKHGDLSSGKQPHSYGKIHHFQEVNPRFLCSWLQ